MRRTSAGGGSSRPDRPRARCARGKAHKIAAGNTACDAHGRFQRPEALARGPWGDERADSSREEARPYEIQHRRFVFERRQYINRHDSVPRVVQGLVAQHLGDLRGSEVNPLPNLQAGLVDPLRPLVRRAQADPQPIRRAIRTAASCAMLNSGPNRCSKVSSIVIA
jgi:hypothetical protein